MYKVCLLAFFISISLLSFAQEFVEEPEFKATKVPDQWSKESAVILAQKIDYAYVRKAMSNVMTIKEYVRKRVRLQDKNALEKFSEFYYVTYGKRTEIAYHIIKANGKVETVDMSQSIEVNGEVENIYKPIYFNNNSNYYKIAIPNLEVGDIVDYKYGSAVEVPLEKGQGEFTPYIFTLTYNYPVVYQKFQFDLDKGTNAMFKSYNGAPKLLEGDGGYEKASEKKSLVSYFIIDKNRSKSSEERWNYEYRNAPTIKLKIVYTGGGLGNTLFGKKGEATGEAVSLDKLKTMYSSLQYYTTPVIEAMVKDIQEYLKNNGKDKLPQDQMVREIYYAFRKLFLESYYKGEIKKQSQGTFGMKRSVVKESKKELSNREDVVSVNKLLWAAVLYHACTRKDLKVEVLTVMPRSLGKWNDLLFEEELDLAMRVKGDKYYFLFPFDNFDIFAHPNPSFDGSEAYAFGLGRSEGYYKANVPLTTFEDNIIKQESLVTIPESMDILNIERVSSYSGLEKNSMITIAHFDREYLNKDFKNYIVNPKKEKGDPAYSDPDKDERKKTQLEYLQKMVERDEVEVEKYNKFELLEDGRFDESPVLSFKENYALKKLVNKAGRNYLLDIGRLIGGQIKLDDKEINQRENDIWINNAKTISNKIVLQLPKGYTADGLQDLNYNIDNESGCFISTAKIEGDKLVVSTKKVYKKNYDRKEMWSNYVAYLEAAYKFTQVKVVLKKA